MAKNWYGPSNWETTIPRVPSNIQDVINNKLVICTGYLSSYFQEMKRREEDTKAMQRVIPGIHTMKELQEGDKCPDDCGGVLAYPPVENCSCHLHPPCGACVNNPLTCPMCGWEQEQDN